MRSRPFRLTLFVGLAVLATVAQAQYVGGLAVTSVADANPDRQDTDSWNFSNTTSATYNVPTFHTVSATLGGGMNGSSFISGQMGILKASSFAEYPADPTGKSAQAHTQVNALDYLTVVSGTLPAGTPVTVAFRLALSGTFSTPVFEQGGLYAASVVGALSANATGGGQFLERYENTNGAAPYDLVGSLATAVGERITLQYGLDTSVYVSGGATVARSATVDFSHTAVATAWSNDPRASLVAASGHSYAPVPEPGSFAALGVGVLALRRRRRKG